MRVAAFQTGRKAVLSSHASHNTCRPSFLEWVAIMSDPALGASIYAACDFLKKIHAQLGLLLNSFDALLDEHGWNPTSAQITNGLIPKLYPEKWQITYLYRFYFPRGATESNRVVGFVIHLYPIEGFLEPPCLAFTARFGEPQSHGSLFESWAWSGSDQPTATSAGYDSVAAIALDRCAEFLPAATMVAGITVPVCSLTCEDDLRTKLVEPLLAAERSFDTPR